MTRRKRGRPPKSGKREPNGRPQRPTTQEAERQAFAQDVRQTVWQARLRQKVGVAPVADEVRALELAGRNAHGLPIIRRVAQTVKERRGEVTYEQREKHRLEARGSVLGRLCADGWITGEMQAAGERYCERYRDYAALNGLPQPVPAAPSYGYVRGGAGRERIAAALRAREAHTRDKAVLFQVRPRLVNSIHLVCVCDEDAPRQDVIDGLKALLAAGR